MQYQIGQANRLGNRHSNQDRFRAIESEYGVLLVLGDGMGGSASGEVAAQTLVDTAEELYSAQPATVRDVPRLFRTIILTAHHRIIEWGARQNPPVAPGSTAVLCLLQEGNGYWAHVGDSRLYLFHKGLPIYRTVDHSYVEQLYQKGRISRSEQESHPGRNMITQCIGCQKSEPEIAYGKPVPLKEGDVLLLCSDGLWAQLDDAQMGSILEDHPLQDSLDRMAERAERNSYPRSDNISVLALRFVSNAAPASDTAAAAQLPKTALASDDPIQSAIAQIEEVLREYAQEIGNKSSSGSSGPSK
ncbi:MAG TPA: protein phosphatase 2C domain-containing protein [Gammaproteobacteria bacterium]